MKIKIKMLLIAFIIFLTFNIPVFAETSTYTVKSGDTLYSISKKFSVQVQDIKNLNSLKSDVLKVGQNLKIPGISAPNYDNYVTYKVVSGDTLGTIAEKFGTSITSIRNLNNLQNDIIYKDQLLKVMVKYEEYKVNPGDTLWGISKKFDLTVSEIQNFNHLVNNTILKVNQIIRIPIYKNTNHTTPTDTTVPTITYTNYSVVSGDNPWKLSVKFGIPMTELLTANNLKADSSLRLGQILKIPVHHIPIKTPPSSLYGEKLDWWKEAQYVFPIGKKAKVTDFYSKSSFYVERTIGANHADCEPSTTNDKNIAKSVWGGYSWVTRPVLVEVDGRKLAGSMTFYPHGIQYITNNDFSGHFDIHFLNSTRHKDGAIDLSHQEKIKISSGIN